MGVWVRSRDKRRLQKVKTVYIGSDRDLWGIYCDGSARPLGTYNTENRCLEILDELQNAIKVGEKKRVVYQMPKEYQSEQK